MTAVLTLPALPTFVAPAGAPEPLTTRVERALRDGGPVPVAMLGATADDERDALLALLALQDATALATAGGVTQTISPVLSAVRGRLERDLVQTLETARARRAGDPLSTLRVIAHAGALPEVYEWAARRATWRELVAFLAVEDVTHAGDPADPAGTLNARDARGPSIATLSRSTLPTEALRLLALDGVLQTGARRDAERIGARAVATLRRASRSRQVIAALHRLRAPASVLPYHLHHGRGDPRVAQRRVAEEVGPLADSADATQAVVRGARWRDAAARRLFADLAARFLAA
jgi:hypothetical protein